MIAGREAYFNRLVRRDQMRDRLIFITAKMFMKNIIEEKELPAATNESCIDVEEL